MKQYTPFKVLPQDIQRDFRASLERDENPIGHFYLVDIDRSGERDYRSQRITVMVVDENGFALSNVRVAFAYSTADSFYVTDDFRWSPPAPYRAFMAYTGGSGEIDQIQGSVIKDGEPGGVDVYIFEPEYSSDVVRGMGMLANHTGVILTFQLRRTGVVTIDERLAVIEQRLNRLEAR